MYCTGGYDASRSVRARCVLAMVKPLRVTVTRRGFDSTVMG
jgi:hypothetical protein